MEQTSDGLAGSSSQHLIQNQSAFVDQLSYAANSESAFSYYSFATPAPGHSQDSTKLPFAASSNSSPSNGNPSTSPLLSVYPTTISSANPSAGSLSLSNSAQHSNLCHPQQQQPLPHLQNYSIYASEHVKHEPSSPSLASESISSSRRSSPVNARFDVSEQAQIVPSSAYTSDEQFNGHQQATNYTLNSEQTQRILTSASLATTNAITTVSNSAENATISTTNFSLAPSMQGAEYGQGLQSNISSQLAVNGAQMLTPHIAGPTCGAKDLTMGSEQR